jgi:hypothetical protein
MKRVLIICLILVVGLIGCNSVEEAEARGLNCDSHFGRAVLNNCIDEDDPKAEIGVGTDVKLWEHEKFTIDQETRLDLNGYGSIDEGDWATYTVMKPKMEKGLLQVIGDFLSGLFNKGE